MARINRKYVRQRFRQAAAAATTTAKGRIVEGLISYLITKVPGITEKERDVLSIARDQEVDVSFFNTKMTRGLPFMPDVILVESKCTASPTSAAEVSRFEIKLRDRFLDWGILFASNGITGNAAQLTAAHQAVSDALSHGKRIIVLTRAECEVLSSGAALVKLLQRKYCKLAASRTSILD